jgi:hypothetical protein
MTARRETTTSPSPSPSPTATQYSAPLPLNPKSESQSQSQLQPRPPHQHEHTLERDIEQGFEDLVPHESGLEPTDPEAALIDDDREPATIEAVADSPNARPEFSAMQRTKTGASSTRAYSAFPLHMRWASEALRRSSPQSGESGRVNAVHHYSDGVPFHGKSVGVSVAVLLVGGSCGSSCRVTMWEIRPPHRKDRSASLPLIHLSSPVPSPLLVPLRDPPAA